MSRFNRKRSIFAWLFLLLVLGLGGAAAFRMRGVETSESLPTGTARRGEFLELITCRGEIMAGKSVYVIAPMNIPELRIVWTVAHNSRVKAGDPIVRFDPSTARSQLAEKTANLQQSQASLDQAMAQVRITAEEDIRALTAARHTVERARLEANKQDIVSKLQGETSRIDLGLAEDKLNVAEATAALHKTSGENRVNSLTRSRNAAQREVDLINQRMASMEMKSPIDGVVSFFNNYTGGYNSMRPFTVGDRLWAGAYLAEIPEMSSIRMSAKIEENDRSRIQAGQQVRIQVDALPEKRMSGELVAISPLTELSPDTMTKNFRGYARFAQIDDRLRPGMNSKMDVVVNKIPDAVAVPTKALFTRHGKPVVYVPSKSGWTPIEVEVQARNADEAAVKGIQGGQTVALLEPGAQPKPGQKKT